MPTAVAANAVAHDDMDYLAQDFKNFNRDFEAMSPMLKRPPVITAEQASGKTGWCSTKGEMGPPKRLKQRDLQWRKRRSPATGNCCGSRASNQIELNLVAKEIDRGTTPQAGYAVEHEGAGASLLQQSLAAVWQQQPCSCGKKGTRRNKTPNSWPAFVR